MYLGIPWRVVAMMDGYGDQLALVDVEGASRRATSVCSMRGVWDRATGC
jgi:hypothetical protein